MKYTVCRFIVAVLSFSAYAAEAYAVQPPDTLPDRGSVPAVTDTSYAERMSAALPGLGPMLPGVLSSDDIPGYYSGRLAYLMQSSVSPVFRYVYDPGYLYTVDYSFGGMWGGVYGSMPLSGKLHSSMGLGSTDIFNVYSWSSVYVGAGVSLAPWLEINGGGLFGVGMFRDMKPLPEFGGRMSLIFRPSDNVGMMLWGEYVDMGTMRAPTFTPMSVPRMTVGASARFKVGDATIGVGASVSTVRP